MIAIFSILIVECGNYNLRLNAIHYHSTIYLRLDCFIRLFLFSQVKAKASNTFSQSFLAKISISSNLRRLANHH
jgi:hypothetical protein